MSKELKKKYILPSEDRHQRIKKWRSNIEFWRDGVDVMERIIKKHAASLLDDNSVLELRELYENIIGSFKNRLQYLSTKIDAFELQYQQVVNQSRGEFFLVNPAEEKSLERELETLNQKYTEYRSHLFTIVRPSSTQDT